MKKSIAVLTLALLVFAGLSISAEAKTNANKQRVFNDVTAGLTNCGTKTTAATINGTAYTINIGTAKLISRNNKSLDCTNLVTSDNLKIWGRIDPANPLVINSAKIRDNSIQRLGSALKGTITGSINPRNEMFTLTTANRGVNTVVLSNSTQIIYKGQTKTFSDLHVGDSVEVTGTWNNNTHIISFTTRVKIDKFATVPTP